MPGDSSRGTARSRRDVLIVGCGIAGLTLAIALGERGCHAEIVEVREDATPPGWGLLLTGSTLRALPLDVAERCVEEGYGFDRIIDCAVDGTVVHELAPPALAGPTLPAMAGIFRPVLHRILAERARELGVEIRLGVTCRELRTEGDAVAVRFSDGMVGAYDSVAGADGVHSQIRGLIGSGMEQHYTDQLVWRALVPRPDWGTSLHTFEGPVHLTGLIPISADRAYVFLTENSAHHARLPDDVLVDTMRGLLAPFSGPLEAVRGQITDPAAIVRRPVEVVLEPLPWHRGRVVLIGDAAHAPSPQLVSGAAMAVEDAILLAEAIAADGEREAALERFGERRFERCRMVVEGSVQMGVLHRELRFDEAHALQGRCFGVLAQPI